MAVVILSIYIFYFRNLKWVQSPGGGAGGESPEAFQILYLTLPKTVKKTTFMGHFFCVLHLKVKGKLIKIKKNVIIFYQILAI